MTMRKELLTILFGAMLVACPTVPTTAYATGTGHSGVAHGHGSDHGGSHQSDETSAELARSSST